MPFLLSPSYCLETGSLSKPEAHSLVRLAKEQDPVIYLHTPLSGCQAGAGVLQAEADALC